MGQLQTQEVVFNQAVLFYMLDDTMEIFSSETAHGWQTFAIVNKEHHFLGDRKIDINTAIFLWEKLHDKVLTSVELDWVMADNGLVKK